MNATILLLDRIAALIHQAVRDDAARHDLLPIHLQVLGYLARANHYSDMPIAVAEYFGISRGSVSQTISVLERKELVARRPDPRNRKRVHLELTAHGRSVLEESWARRLERILSGHPGVDPEALAEGLRDLLQALQQENGQQAFGVCHRCAHFLEEAGGFRCGLTGESLAVEQREKICREWTQAAES
jgi:MarR family transcriptional regulator, negative regulator of the multidrug operon emrRAB